VFGPMPARRWGEVLGGPGTPNRLIGGRRNRGAAMDFGGWSLGLEQYEAAFRENEINVRVLRSLTQEDLGFATEVIE
jgi:hypothetical protein